jgi:bacillithiol biosynthesis cysteine-adding enzyme BshC
MSGEPPLKAQCLPFSQVPHSSRLFLDYLSGVPDVKRFFPRDLHFSQWVKDEAANIQYDSGRRQRVANILERQNKSWGASARTLENISRLKSGAAAVVTGQQVGLFGGPLFALFKALTAVKLAQFATQAGVDSVPVFWLATQDHDLEEIQQTFLPGAEASLEKLTASSSGATGAPVGTISLGPQIQEVVKAAEELLGESDVTTVLRESYSPDATYGSSFARLFAKLFDEWGVILLDACDPELNAIAAPIYQKAIEHSAELYQALVSRDQELEVAGYHQQVKVTSSSTLLFGLRNGARTPIQREGNTPANFLLGDEKLTQTELLNRISLKPQEFSANALLRPVVQDYLLPTLAYTGGPAEVAYFAQAAVIYKALSGRVTPIIPRFSATIVETKANGLLERYGLTLTDLFQNPEKVREQLAARALPQELNAAFEAAANNLGKSFATIRESLTRLDKTLVDAAENAESKIRHQLEGLQAKAARAELRQSEVLDRHAKALTNGLYPNKTLQEREIGGIHFLARYGKEFLRDVYENIHPDCFDHQILTM